MNDGQWKPGQSGNPSGRTPKMRALTELLEAAGNAEYRVGDQVLTGKDLLARMVWQYVIDGKVDLPDGRRMRADGKEWAAMMQWLYKHIDGSRAEIDLTGDIDLDMNSLKVVVHGQSGAPREEDDQDDTRVQNSDNG